MNKRSLTMVLTLCLIIIIPQYTYAKALFTGAVGLTGGATSDLDGIECDDALGDATGRDLVTGDVAFVITSAKDAYIYRYDSTGTDAESSPDIIVPDNQSSCSSAGQWELVESFSTAKVSEPISAWRDLDCIDNDDNVYIYTNCPGTGSGAENCEFSIYVQDTGVAVEMFKIDAVANMITFGRSIDISDLNIENVNIMWADRIRADSTTLILGDDDEEVHVVGDGTPGANYGYNCFSSISGFDSGEDIDFGEVVYMDDTATEWMLADATTGGAKWPAIGFAVACPGGGDITTEPCQNAEEITICTNGSIRRDAWAWTGEGKVLYVDEVTAGGLTETAPSTTGDLIQIMAVSLNDDHIIFPVPYYTTSP